MIGQVAHVAASSAPVLRVLADDGTGDPTGESVKSGPLGLVVIILLCIGCYFLFKSMSKHLRRVREQFPAQLPGDPPAGASAPDPAGANLAHPVDPGGSLDAGGSVDAAG